MRNIIASSLLQPGIFIVAHIIYFGPLVIICILYWKQITKLVHENGLGLTLAMSVSLMFSLFSESRTHIVFWPFLVPFIAQVIDQSQQVRGTHVALITFLSILLSKAWLPFNNIKNPTEIYFSHIGPWMKPNSYLINLIVTVILLQIIIQIHPPQPIKANKLLKV